MKNQEVLENCFKDVDVEYGLYSMWTFDVENQMKEVDSFILKVKNEDYEKIKEIFKDVNIESKYENLLQCYLNDKINGYMSLNENHHLHKKSINFVPATDEERIIICDYITNNEKLKLSCDNKHFIPNTFDIINTK